MSVSTSASSAAVPGAPRSPAWRAAPAGGSPCGRAIRRFPPRSRAIAAIRSICPGFPLDAGIEAAADLADLGACDAILLVCPAQAVRELAARLAGTAPVVICAKGIEASSGLLMPEVLAEVLPGRPLAMLSGPSFAEEAVRGLPTAVSIATADHALGRDAGQRPGGRRVPAILDRRRVRRGAGRRGEERARHRRRHRRGPRPRPQRGRRADHARLRRDGAARPGDGREARDPDGPERARRSGADLPRPAVAQPLAGRWRWARAPRSPITWPAAARSSKARRRRRRCWRAPRDTKSRCRFVPPSMLSCMAARTSTRRSARCWRARCGAKENERRRSVTWLLAHQVRAVGLFVGPARQGQEDLLDRRAQLPGRRSISRP